MKQEKSCGAICWRQGETGREYLLLRHANGGHWAFAKGHVEGKETEEQTALREIAEETGLSARLDTGFRRTTAYSPAPGVWKEVIYFVADIAAGRQQRQLEEVEEIAWLPLDTALATLTYEADRQLLTAAAQYLDQKQN